MERLEYPLLLRDKSGNTLTVHNADEEAGAYPAFRRRAAWLQPVVAEPVVEPEPEPEPEPVSQPEVAVEPEQPRGRRPAKKKEK